MILRDVIWDRRRFSAEAKEKRYAGRFPELSRHNAKYDYAHATTRAMIMVQEIRERYPIGYK